MQKDIMLSFFRLQSDGETWGEAVATVDMAKDAQVVTDPIHMEHTGGIIQIQVFHNETGSPTITGEILESVDGVTYVENGTGFGDTIAKNTTVLYTHDAKANRFVKLQIDEDNVAATVLTLSIAVR